jgi:hypothetical protein
MQNTHTEFDEEVIDEEIMKKLEEYGQQFLINFDDYEETKVETNPSSDENVAAAPIKANKSHENRRKMYGPVNKPKLVEKRAKVTIFNGEKIVEDKEINPIKHHSVDKIEADVALSVSELKQLKRKRHEMEELERREKSKEFKKLKKGPAFDIENNRSIARKDERQRELDQLTSNIKSFVYSKTLEGDRLRREEQEELKKQGKAFHKVKGQAMNYKQLKDKIAQERKERKKELKESRENGTFDKKKFAKELIRRKQLKEASKYKFLSRHGAPSDIGKVDKRVHSKFATGTVGQWKKGQLVLSKRDIYNITKKKN